MKKIPLSKNKFAIVDDDLYEYLMQWNWHTSYRGTWYAARKDGRDKTVYMHRVIMDAIPGKEVDHRDGNGLNNTRSNLRVVSHKENLRNQKRSSANTSGYKGVSWHKRGHKWQAYITVDQQHIHLGLHSKKEDAACVYNKAAMQHFGLHARLNPLECGC
jgi:hypothetical protein